jgi:cobyrinic acid a,c-diamide synthase
MFDVPRLIIAAPRGGAGKTLCTLGLLAALRAKGHRVVPFKKGPDYIDAGWLSFAAGSPCYNLDPFFMSEKVLVSSFLAHSQEGSLAIIEGNRGLFDGVDPEGTCSTAQLARVLKAPVLLVLDCTKVTRTLAAFVKGCQVLEEGMEIAGIILNQIVRARHEKIIRESIERYTGVPVLGVLPRLKKFAFPMRHLGLLPWQEHEDGDVIVERLREVFLENVDLSAIEALARKAPPLEGEPLSFEVSSPEVTIGVFRDAAFQFYYPENLKTLEVLGAKVVEFNALTLQRLPQVEALYIGGGFPETQAPFLAENRTLRQDLKEAIESGLPVYAECGGLMFLGREILWQGKSFPMVGALPLDFEVCEHPQGHGYVIGQVVRENPFYPVGASIRGHEFHYSRPVNIREDLPFAFRLEKGHGFGARQDGILYRNILGAYTHVHVLGVPVWAEGLVTAAKEYKMQNWSLHSLRKEVEGEKGENFE